MNRRGFILGGAALAAALLTARRAFGMQQDPVVEPRHGTGQSGPSLLAAMRLDNSLAERVRAEGERTYSRLGMFCALNLSKGPVSVADSAALNPATAFGRYVTDERFRAQVMPPAPGWDGSFKGAKDTLRSAALYLEAAVRRHGGGHSLPVLLLVNAQVASCLCDVSDFVVVEDGIRPQLDGHSPYEIGRVGGMIVASDPGMPWADTRFTACCNGIAITSGVYLGPKGVLV